MSISYLLLGPQTLLQFNKKMTFNSLTEVISEGGNAAVFGLVHGNNGGLDGVLELGSVLVCPVHQAERAGVPFAYMQRGKNFDICIYFSARLENIFLS